ncbi:hypothetical protein [Salinisphaera hydrothermalis]|uniref:hypothetical protein n=1 Tax=Salinisphaera hydrothermalis TaxID=563188 RepID=UPI003342B4FA
MKHLVEAMLNRLEKLDHDELIRWAAPIPCFGRLERAEVATLGINPSDREFLDTNGAELNENERRFHTLNSLGIIRWSHANRDNIETIVNSCDEYFFRNPYRAWFDRLEPIICATGRSYYDRMFPACHIDLLPFATSSKWGELRASRRKLLLAENSDLLYHLLEHANFRVLILNGRSVVSEFVTLTGALLEGQEMPTWALRRSNKANVKGYCYRGILKAINGFTLRRPLTVLGFNHNIQSSFGVTNDVVTEIASWVNKQEFAVE